MRYQLVRILTFVVLVIGISACGGGGGGSDSAGSSPAPINLQPTSQIVAPSEAVEGDVVSLDGASSTDPEGRALVFTWSQVSGPVFSFSSTTNSTPTFIAPDVDADSTVVVRLTVSDGALSANSEVSIVIERFNEPPVANAVAPIEALEGAVLRIDGSASSDPDGDPITFSWTQTAGPIVVLSDAEAASPTFVLTGIDTDTILSFDLTVSDDSLATDMTAISFTVQPSIEGRALLGPIVGGLAELFDLTDLEAGPVYMTTTLDADELSSVGKFFMPESFFIDERVFVIRVSGGRDIDADDNGVRNDTPSDFLSAIRSIGMGADYKSNEQKATINAITEVAYQSVAALVASVQTTADLILALDNSAESQLVIDINEDGVINRLDLLAFNPLTNVEAYRLGQVTLARLNSGILNNTISASARSEFTKPLLSSLADVKVANDVFVLDDIAYVASGSQGLVILDVSEPGNPIVLVNYGFAGMSGFTQSVEVVGSVAYVAHGQGMVILDVSDPASPILLSQVVTDDNLGSASGVAVVGSIALLADQVTGLHIIDVTNPTQPTLISAVDTINAEDVSVEQDIAYVAAGGRYVAIDISVPSTPTIIGGLDIPDNGLARNILVEGNRLYLTFTDFEPGFRSALQIVDTSAPSAPVVINEFEFDSQSGGFTVAGDKAFVTLTPAGFGELVVIDISDSETPTEVSRFRSFDSPSQVFVRDGLAYIADNSSVGLHIVNTDGQEPAALLQRIETPVLADVAEATILFDLQVRQRTVYFAADLKGVQIFDFENLSNPELLATVVTNRRTSGVDVSGQTMFITDRSDGLEILDISNPRTPASLSTLQLGQFNYGKVRVADDVAYVVAGISDEIFTIDVSNLSAPEAIGDFDPSPRVNNFTLSNGKAYVAGGGLAVLDITNPAAISRLGGRVSPRSHDVQILDNVAYVANSVNGLLILDVSDPTNPTDIASFDTDGDSVGIAVANGYAYVADKTRGLKIFDVSNPQSPFLAESLLTPGDANAVVFEDGIVYVVDSVRGLVLYRALTGSRQRLLFDTTATSE